MEGEAVLAFGVDKKEGEDGQGEKDFRVVGGLNWRRGKK